MFLFKALFKNAKEEMWNVDTDSLQTPLILESFFIQLELVVAQEQNTQ